jgi:prepilin-type processing-associated H-X9-DG protein
MVHHKTHAFLALAFLGSIVPTVAGQSQDIGRLLAPCVGEQTLAVARIDMARVDIDALSQMAIETAAGAMNTEQIGQVKEIVGHVAETWKPRVAQFKSAGGETLFIILSTEDMLLAVPTAARLDEAAMKNWFNTAWNGTPTSTVRKDGLLVAAPEWTIKRWQDRTPAPRPELSQAAGKATQAVVTVYVIPSADSRRVLEAVLPPTLGEGVQIKDNALVKGFQWATVNLGLPPAPSLRLYVESADAASAGALRDFLATTLTLVGRIPILKQAYPDLEAPVAMLTPKVESGSLQLTLDEQQSRRLAANFLTPGLFELRASLLRYACGTTLSGMGKAMLIYANDYNDEWPPSLETLVEKAEYPRSGLVCPAMKHRPDYKSYVYRGVDTGGTSVEPNIIMVHDRAGNHPGGRNVLFVDSHVEWVTEEEFQKLIERDNELRRGRGLSEKPAE